MPSGLASSEPQLVADINNTIPTATLLRGMNASLAPMWYFGQRIHRRDFVGASRWAVRCIPMAIALESAAPADKECVGGAAPPVGSQAVAILTRDAVLPAIDGIVVALVTKTVLGLPTEVRLARRLPSGSSRPAPTWKSAARS